MEDNRYILISKKKLIELISVGAVIITILTGTFCYGFSNYYAHSAQVSIHEDVVNNLQDGGK